MLPYNSVTMCSNPVTIAQVTIAPLHQELPPYFILLVANEWGHFLRFFALPFPVQVETIVAQWMAMQWRMYVSTRSCSPTSCALG